MRLAVSNIAWDRHDDPAVYATLAAAGVRGIEIAPTKLWPDWRGATPASAAAHRARLADEGFAVPSLQAVLFGRPELRLFGTAAERRAFIDHMSLVADLAAALGALSFVFGAPRQRDPGDRTPDAAFAEAVAVLAAVGERCAERGVVLALEPNPPDYGARFVTRAAEGRRLVAAVGSPGVRLHLDSACMRMAGDDGPAEIAAALAAGLLASYHASEPQLGDFAAPACDHAALGRALAAGGYAGWLSVEMRRTEPEREAIATACAFARAAYAPVLAGAPA